MSEVLRLELLGGHQISRGATPLTGFVSSKATALLAYLAISPEAHSRASLAGLFWGESDEEAARASLRVVLSNLRQIVGREYFDTDRATVAFNRASSYWLDVEDFETQVGASAALQRDRAVSWRSAIDLYKGDLLEGASVRNAPDFDVWLAIRREQLRQLAIGALDALIADAAGRGEISETTNGLTRLLELDPWREDAHRQLMSLLVDDGRRNAAILQYQHCRQLLADELGIEPESETTRLYQAILEGGLAERPVAKDTATLPAPTRVAGRPGPVGPHTSFIGREAELQQIVARLDDPACRLLTLIGPGGAGKSRLALQASADRRLGFRDGVHIVSLASVSAPEYIVPAIVAATGAKRIGSGDPQRQLLRFLQDRELLLVLDNFEHLIDGTPLLHDILDAAPRVKLLVTSRERLAVRAEWLVQVGGLPVPDDLSDAGIAPPASVRLFIERARQVHADFTTSAEAMASVIRICRLLDGMPLGIELAAAWTRTHACAEIATRIEENLDFLTAPMRDVPERHHSLRAVFMHSWALLDRRSQRVLQALAVFRGGFLRAAAEAVAGASTPDLVNLVDKSLLYREVSGRYALHELVRQYAGEQLASSPGALDAHRRHADFFADLLRASEPALRSNAQQDATQHILADIDNVRAAWRWAIAQRDLAILDRALDGLQLFTELTSRFQERKEALESAIAAVDESEPGAERQSPARDVLYGRLLGWSSRSYVNHGQFNESAALMERSLTLLEGHDSELAQVYALDTRAIIANGQGRQEEALRLQQAALAASEARGDRLGMSFACKGMGGIAFNSGDFPTARSWFDRCLKVRRELGDWDDVVDDLSRVGEAARLLGNYQEARLRNEESLAIQREIGHDLRAILPLMTLGELAIDEGRLEDAERRFRRANRLAADSGTQRSLVETERGLATVMLHRGELEQARAAAGEALSTARTNGFALGIMRCLELQARIAARLGDWQAAQDIGTEVHRMSSAANNRYQIGRAEVLLGRAATALGARSHAGQLLDRAYRRLTRTGARPAMLDTVASTAELLAASADGGHLERATELVSLVLRDPATWFETRQRAVPLLARLSDSLQAADFEAARQRGEQQRLTDLTLPGPDVVANNSE